MYRCRSAQNIETFRSGENEFLFRYRVNTLAKRTGERDLDHKIGAVKTFLLDDRWL